MLIAAELTNDLSDLIYDPTGEIDTTAESKLKIYLVVHETNIACTTRTKAEEFVRTLIADLWDSDLGIPMPEDTNLAMETYNYDSDDGVSIRIEELNVYED